MNMPVTDHALILVMERMRERLVRLPKDEGAERRASRRFPLTLEVRYAVSGRVAPVETGSGLSINLSSSGMSFMADRPLLPGQKLAIAIDWPVRLDGSVNLQLILSGLVIRSKGTVTAMEILRYEFKTRRIESKVTPLRESIC